MTPQGVAGMSCALAELRKALDELCGATARAGWIVDTWGAYQGGKLDGSSFSSSFARSPEAGLGSAAINGVEIGLEAAGLRSGLHAPIGRPHSERGKVSSSTSDATEIGESGRPATGNQSAIANEKVGSALSGTGTFRPPPGLAFPLKPMGDIGQMPRAMNGSKRFPLATCGVEGNIAAVNGVHTDSAATSADKDRSLLQRGPSIGASPLFDVPKI